MSEMKDSCIKWIGKIPIEWSTKRVKYLATKPESLFIDGDWIESDVIIEKGIRYLTTGNVGAGFFKEQGSGYISEETFKKLKCLKVLPGDLMISRLNEPIGRACIVPDTEDFYVVAVDNVILRPNKEFDKKFIMYCMNTTGYSEDANDAARGSTMQRVSRSILGTFIIPITSIEEQKNIVKFLDNKVGKIDEILTFLYNQISILNKYKQSLITEVVTKGLNNNAKMKDSGIDWIGEIPETWEIKKLKYLGTARNGLTYSPDDQVDEGILVLRSSNIREGKLEFKDNVYVNMKVPRNIILKKDDLLICSRNGSRNLIGKNALIDEKTAGQTYGAFMCVYRSKYNKFIHYILNSDIFTYYLSSFLTSTINQLTNENLYSIKIPFTYDIKEQEEIVNYLDKKCQEIDELIEDKQQQIEKMKQYKKSLIYEYVTGKKRVKGAEELYG